MRKITRIINKWLIVNILFLPVVGCSSIKIDKDQQKIGIPNKDYTINFHKRKHFESGYVTFKVFEGENSVPINDFSIALNGVSVNKQNGYYLHNNRKYDIQVSSVGGYKSVIIPNVLIKEKDSVIIHIFLKEGAVF